MPAVQPFLDLSGFSAMLALFKATPAHRVSKIMFAVSSLSTIPDKNNIIPVKVKCIIMEIHFYCISDTTNVGKSSLNMQNCPDK